MKIKFIFIKLHFKILLILEISLSIIFDILSPWCLNGTLIVSILTWENLGRLGGVGLAVLLHG